MTPSFRISAIVPTWNRRRPLAAALKSAFAQTLPLHELIVVDDGSSDGTWEDLTAIPGRVGATTVKVLRQKNAGVSAARNAGLALATGEFVAFLDSDDAWHPGKSERQIEVFRADPGLALVGCAADILVLRGGAGVRRIGERRLLLRNYFVTPGVMLRRSVALDLGGFAEDMARCEDYDLWLRVAAGHRCALLNEVLVGCREGKRSFGHDGLSADLWALWQAELDTYRRWRARGGPAGVFVMAAGVSSARALRRWVMKIV